MSWGIVAALSRRMWRFLRTFPLRAAAPHRMVCQNLREQCKKYSIIKWTLSNIVCWFGSLAATERSAWQLLAQLTRMDLFQTNFIDWSHLRSYCGYENEREQVCVMRRNLDGCTYQTTTLFPPVEWKYIFLGILLYVQLDVAVALLAANDSPVSRIEVSIAKMSREAVRGAKGIPALETRALSTRSGANALRAIILDSRLVWVWRLFDKVKLQWVKTSMTIRRTCVSKNDLQKRRMHNKHWHGLVPRSETRWLLCDVVGEEKLFNFISKFNGENGNGVCDWLFAGLMGSLPSWACCWVSLFGMDNSSKVLRSVALGTREMCAHWSQMFDHQKWIRNEINGFKRTTCLP